MIDARTRELLQDMREYAQISFDLAAGLSPAEVQSDIKTYLALCHAVQIVGEAASRIDPAVRPPLPTTPWRDLIGTRNVIVHGYAHVDVRILIEVAQRHMPILIAEIDAILGSPNP